MRRIRWAGVIVGAAATALISFLLALFVSSVIVARLYRAFIAEGAGMTAREDALFNILSGVSHLVAVLLAFFLGGLVAGGVAAAFPGLNGAVGAAVVALGSFAWFVAPLVPWIWEPISNPGEVYTRFENLGNLLRVSLAHCAVLPFVVLAGYAGGKLGGRLRNRSWP